MAKTKVSLYDPVAANNTDINSINIAEGMAPSDVNNAIRELMAEIKQFQTGSASDPLSVGGALTLLNTLITSSSAGSAGQVLLSQGASTPPAWGTMTIFPVGAIYISTVATNPAVTFGFGTWVAFASGKVMIGAGGGFTAGATGGSADAIVVSHAHTGTTDSTSLTGGFTSGLATASGVFTAGSSFSGVGQNAQPNYPITMNASHTHTLTTNSTGVSGANANLQPYIVVYIWNRVS